MGEVGSPLWVCNREEFTRLFGGEIGNPLWVCIRGIGGGLAGRWGDGRKGEIGRERKEDEKDGCG